MDQDPFNPYQAPETQELETGWSHDPGMPPPLPWEDPGHYPTFWGRVGAMFALAFTDPFTFFDRVPATEAFGAPVLFLLLLCIPSMLFQVVIGLAMGAFMQKAIGEDPAFAKLGGGWLWGGMMGMQALLFPIMAILSSLFFGLLDHAALWMWGGLKPGRSLLQTMRACLYTGAFMYLIMVVPLLGPLCALVMVIFLGMGLSRIHRCETWKGVLTIFTPILFCCACYLAMFIAVFGMSKLIN